MFKLEYEWNQQIKNQRTKSIKIRSKYHLFPFLFNYSTIRISGQLLQPGFLQ